MYPLDGLTSDLTNLRLDSSKLGDDNGEISCELLAAGDMDQLSLEIEKER